MKFETINDYKKFLENKVENISKIREYDFRCHYIDVFGGDNKKYGGETYPEVSKAKAESIIKNGLYLCNSSISDIPYTSINGTSAFLTESENFNAQNIIDYKYTSPSQNDRMVVIFAIPKYVNYKGNKIEFSCYKNVRALDDKNFEKVPEIKEAYKGLKDIRFANFGLLDCILGTTFPKEYILGAHFISPQTNSAYFIENPNHLSNLPKEQFDEFKNDVYLKISRTGINDNASNLLDVMVRTTTAEYNYYTNREFEDF